MELLQTQKGKVHSAFYEIKSILPDEAEDFECTYIGTYSNRDTGTVAIALTWREPPFPPVIWSVYECTL